MATVYTIEVTSHWVNYPEEQIKEAIEKSLSDMDAGNEITVNVIKST